MANKNPDVPSYVPAPYTDWVQKAATGTGLPTTVVAAQINDESGFNPAATSPAGAEGIAQFLPSTYADVGGKGSEYVAANELHPYIRLTNQNLKWADQNPQPGASGNIQQALAAYNAGQGNWQAGIGYANSILSEAGNAPTNVNPTGSSSGPSGFFNFFTSDSTYERAGLIIAGALIFFIGLITAFIAHKKGPKPMPPIQGEVTT